MGKNKRFIYKIKPPACGARAAFAVFISRQVNVLSNRGFWILIYSYAEYTGYIADRQVVSIEAEFIAKIDNMLRVYAVYLDIILNRCLLINPAGVYIYTRFSSGSYTASVNYAFIYRSACYLFS